MSATDLIAAYEPPVGVALSLQAVGSHAATFDIATEPALRGSGLGSAAMAELILLADECGVELHIWAEPDPEQQSLASLVCWYQRYGFEPTGRPTRGAQRMVRRIETA